MARDDFPPMHTALPTSTLSDLDPGTFPLMGLHGDNMLKAAAPRNAPSQPSLARSILSRQSLCLCIQVIPRAIQALLLSVWASSEPLQKGTIVWLL